ncbi:Os04g0171232 [Oryza sativa Japonica Group]|uniref:Os04g0170866 protein n=1 Tax=Oryza sativa subsp. japonica TaxID=39947 RepID=A0A0P0W7B9_ORYSJ|nr:hypothetical protein EE612_022213 [Oryza sativa]BAS87905.1 Os04g0170866 [Oryza sativa Japonica Group]BAS87906.1 Os04g0171232 [Oryza sativa Japonica Group]
MRDQHKMFARELETIKLRVCWSLRSIPAIADSRHQDSRPVVD